MTIDQIFATEVAYLGDGTQKKFPVPFPFFAQTDVQAVLITGTGTQRVEKKLVYGTEYTVRELPSVGGELTVTIAPAKKSRIVVYLDIPTIQKLDLNDSGRLPAERLEAALDKLTMILLQHNAWLERTLAVPVGADEKPEDIMQRLLDVIAMAEATVGQLITLSIAVDDAPYGHVASGSYNAKTNMLTLRVPEGRAGKDGDKGDLGKEGKAGLQGPPGPAAAPGEKGPMGDSPWSIAFGQMRIDSTGMLLLECAGTTEANDFFINTNGVLEVTI